MKITVNGKTVEWSGSTLDYGVVLSLANERPGASVVYSCPRRGDAQRSGILHAQSPAIAVEDDMKIECVMTGNA